MICPLCLVSTNILEVWYSEKKDLPGVYGHCGDCGNTWYIRSE